MWTYRAYATRVIDGDTVELEIDLGLRVTVTQTVRVAGINAPEVTTTAGRTAQAAVNVWMGLALIPDGANAKWPLTITTAKPDGNGDKYGRWLASISRADGRDLATDMIAAGHAIAWDGKGQKPVAS